MRKNAIFYTLGCRAFYRELDILKAHLTSEYMPNLVGVISEHNNHWPKGLILSNCKPTLRTLRTFID
jgi:hypothetical protein